MLASQSTNAPGVQVISNCATVEDFVTKFRRFCSGASVFVPTGAPVPLGVHDHFSIRLRDGEPVLSGFGEVIESQTKQSASGTSRMIGMRIKFIAMDANSQSVFQWMLAAGKLVEGSEQTTPLPRASATVAAPAEVPTAPSRGRVLETGALHRFAGHAIALVAGLCVAYQIWGA